MAPGYDLQDRIQNGLDELVAAGSEVGVQVAVVRRGRLVVDAVSGAGATSDSLFWAASTAKCVASSLAHVLVERGVLAYDLRLADVWPEFGVHGKQHVTLRHVLMHTAGVPGLPPDTTAAQLCDVSLMCAQLAAATPWWEPGTAIGYHAQTFGFLLGETIRRVTGATLTEVLHAELTGPLGIADEVHFGVPAALLDRVVAQVPAGAPPEPEPGTPLARALPPGVRPTAAFANRRDILTSDIASFGTMSARGTARLLAGELGHVDGVDLVSPDRLAAMAAPAFSGLDQVMGFPTTWAFGYAPGRFGGVASRPGSAFGMVGANGSAAWADIDSGVAMAVMRSRFVPGDLSAVQLVDEAVARAYPG
ncbi:serine hydrolase domain-containing protein [Pseudonocardia sp. GCM10023141]|uniref:serine hydrolase domain-containing protein n=1 Tax=Pseudonocardia sp. GCM10023141 TaxID=3252653 RepID=UPI0036107B1E